MTNVKFCSCCTDDRKKHNRSPRPLVGFADDMFKLAINGKNIFKDRETPVYLCPHCDGDALPRTQEEVLKRAA
jgi:hypothetical protein